MNGMFTLATLIGMSVSHLTRGTIVANLGFTDVRFLHPLFHGDTLYGASVVRETRSSDRDRTLASSRSSTRGGTIRAWW
jgi:acyl dehydratase